MKGLRLSPQTEFKKGNKPWNAGIKTTKGSYNREARKLFLASGKLLICENCQTTKNIQIHHKDKDYKNQDINNLQPLCGKCHAKHHYPEKKEHFHGGMVLARENRRGKIW